MNLTAWVDVAIGLTLIYLGAGLLVTLINEYIAQALNLRGRNLCSSLQTLIDNDDIRATLKQSPAISRFFDSQPGKAPSYVDPSILAQLLVGGLAAGANVGDATKQVASTLEKLPDSSLKIQLQALVSTAGSSAETLTNAVADWANRSLTVLGEGYKQQLQKISFAIGLAVAISFNLDTVILTRHLYNDHEARDATVALGIQIVDKTAPGALEKCLKLDKAAREKDAACVPLSGLLEVVQGRSQNLGQLPIGWPANETGACNWGLRILGWLLTALALSLGAPFWFDLLNKLVNFRYGMRKPEQGK